jgi:hypothetical protein
MRERYRNAVEQRVAADEAGASDGASQLNAVLDRIRGAIGMAKVPFPDVQIGEFTVMRPFTAPGLFAYRHMQADGLLRFPDMGDGDMSAEQRREVLARMANLQRPLVALVLFLNVVALEDFIRDLGARLADVPGLDAHFPNVSELRPRLVNAPRPFARLDRDPAPLSNLTEVNALYLRVLGVEPIASGELPLLQDLALVRHIVAHHAALVRPIDAPRFQHWEVRPNALLNLPIEFAREMASVLYRTGHTLETAVRNRLFSVILASAPPDWVENPPELVVALIELFNWFGKLLTDNEPALLPGSPNYEEDAVARATRSRATLMTLCLHDLRSQACGLTTGCT